MESEKYHLELLLGQGAFGKCYLVKSHSDNQKYVIKQINMQGMSKEERKEVYQESFILKKMSHPNIIAYKDSFINKSKKLCIVMEYASEGDLRSYMRAQKGNLFPEESVISIFLQICLAVKHMHDRKLLHRDIKSENVLRTQDGMIKLGDFGISKILKFTHDKALTVAGTPSYMCPEVVKGKPYDSKCDIWSLGVLLHELCTLKRTFKGSMSSVTRKIASARYHPISSLYSLDLALIIQKLMSIDPTDRPTINQLLKFPLLNNKIHCFLSPDVIREEFSHTVIHNYSLLSSEQSEEDSIFK